MEDRFFTDSYALSKLDSFDGDVIYDDELEDDGLADFPQDPDPRPQPLPPRPQPNPDPNRIPNPGKPIEDPRDPAPLNPVDV